MDATFFWRLSKLGRLGSSKLRFDDDFVDRLNYQFTGMLLFMFIGLIGIRQYVGKPIQCWIPQEFTRGWEEYTENYCWVSNTYFASVHQRMPSHEQREQQMIGYYQWAPILLGLQSLLFYIPCLVWRYASPQSGFNVRRILQVASDANCCLVPEQLQKSISFIARHMDACLHRQRQRRQPQHQHLHQHLHQQQQRHRQPAHPPLKTHHSGRHTRPSASSSHQHQQKHQQHQLCSLYKCLADMRCGGGWCVGRHRGNFLSALYLGVKMLYLVNIGGQLFLMERFIGTSYTSFYGVRVLWDLLSGREWHHSGNFPRVTFCDIEAKKLGKNHLYSLQCVLPMNMFLEKIYIFLWFWLVLVGLATLTSLLTWTHRLLGPARTRVQFVRAYLRLMNALQDTDRGSSRHFADRYLRCDGCLILYLIAGNVGDLVAGDLVCELWHVYRHKRVQEFEEIKITGATLNLESRMPSLMLNNTSNLNEFDKAVPGSSSNNNNHDEIV